MALQNVFRQPLPRHSHNLSESRFFDMDMGVLTPIYLSEMYPGDKVRIQERAVIESRTLNSPLKNNVTYREYWFFVPRRLMWRDWEKFIFGGKTGDFTAVPPYITIGIKDSTTTAYSSTDYKSLWDYFGFPICNTTRGDQYTLTENLRVDAMPFAAYQMIYKDWFRNENFSDEHWDFENNGSAWLQAGSNNDIYDDTGTDVSSYCGYLDTKRNAPWSRNYFTAALPFRQRGTANRVPLHGSAFLYNGIVDSDGNFNPSANKTGSVNITRYYRNPSTGAFESGLPSAVMPGVMVDDTNGNLTVTPDNSGANDTYVYASKNSGTYYGIDGSELQGFTITELRLLAKLQEFQEINARFGFRYIEGLRGHFGVSPTDARLDRPEFIGGFRQEIVFNEILQTSSTATTPSGVASPLGTPAGRGISAGAGRIGSYYAEEHGILIGLATIMPQQIYTQGVPRMWTRHTKEEFFSPEFNGLSEQEVKEQEIYADASMTSDQLSAVFGFVPAWEELRHGKTMALGNLRNPQQLDLYTWTMARHFNSAPVLGENFLFASQSNSNGGIRTDAWTTGNTASPFFVSLHHVIRKTSTVSKSGVPGITRI